MSRIRGVRDVCISRVMMHVKLKTVQVRSFLLGECKLGKQFSGKFKKIKYTTVAKCWRSMPLFFHQVKRGVNCFYSSTYAIQLNPFKIKISTSEVHTSNHSFTFTPAFPLRRVLGSAALGRLEIPHDFQQSLIILVPLENWTKHVVDVITPPGLWSTYGPLSRGCSQ